MSGDAIALVAVVALFFVATLLAIAETAFLRMSRVKALALEDEGDKRADGSAGGGTRLGSDWLPGQSR